MVLIDNLSNFANQSTTVLLPDGSSVVVSLLFNGATERWTMSVVYGTRTIPVGLCCHPNILRQWKNLLPFGIACVTSDQTDPFAINDFSSGRVLLYLLNADDVEQVETLIFGGA